MEPAQIGILIVILNTNLQEGKRLTPAEHQFSKPVLSHSNNWRSLLSCKIFYGVRFFLILRKIYAKLFVRCSKNTKLDRYRLLDFSRNCSMIINYNKSQRRALYKKHIYTSIWSNSETSFFF